MDPRDMLNDPDKIKDIIAMLQALLPQTEATATTNKTKKTKTAKTTKAKSTTTSKKNSKNKTSEDTAVNKFLQMQEMYMFKDDAAIDKKLSKNPPIPRTRHFEPVKVQCRVCGRSDQVNPSLVYDVSRYKCNNCSSSQG